MIRLRRALVRKVLASSALALLLLCVPIQLAAQVRETPTAAHVSVLAWFTGLWCDLTAWFASGVVTPPPPPPGSPPESTTDNSCAIDPNGACGG